MKRYYKLPLSRRKLNILIAIVSLLLFVSLAQMLWGFNKYRSVQPVDAAVALTTTPAGQPTANADANDDGVVNESDLAILRNNYKLSLSGKQNGDFNFDGLVNGFDYIVWLMSPPLGGGTTSPTSTPSNAPTGTNPFPTVAATNSLKPRLIVMTDLGCDPDDQQSLVRVMAHADLLEVESMIATTSFCNPTIRPNMFDPIFTAYGQDLSNLMRRSNQSGFASNENIAQQVGYWPSLAYFQARKKSGQPQHDLAYFGSGRDTEGSNHIISVIDENDSRPVWVAAFGGCNTFAQSLYRVKTSRTQAEFDRFVAKARFFAIDNQDTGCDWIRANAPQLTYLWSRNSFRDMNAMTQTWYSQNIQNHGNLGRVYPNHLSQGRPEGDTPSFLSLLVPGLNGWIENPDWGGWSGRYERLAATSNVWGDDRIDLDGQNSLTRWLPQFNNEFAARMDWANTGTGNRNPKVVVGGVSTDSVMYVNRTAGTLVTLNAAGSSDPDGNQLTYKWRHDANASSYSGSVSLSSPNAQSTQINFGSGTGSEVHIILEVTDTGSPQLTSYRRIVIRL